MPALGSSITFPFISIRFRNRFRNPCPGTHSTNKTVTERNDNEGVTQLHWLMKVG